MKNKVTLRQIDADVVDIQVPGFNNGETVLQVDFEKCVVTRLSSGETINFSTDKNGFNRRPNSVLVPSETSDKEYRIYKVDEDDPRTWICTCPDFEHRRSEMGQTCKHIGYEIYGYYIRI